MELIYLWVEEYKNIKQQGFNFSPKFTCKYEDGTLTINKKEPEPINIFPPNINITAIVGENGSGKSSIFEILSKILCLNNLSKYFYVLNDGTNNVCYSCDLPLKVDADIEIIKYTSLHQQDEKLVRSNGNKKVALKEHIDMYYLNISHLEREGIIRNDYPTHEDPINYLGIYEKNDLRKGSGNSFYSTFTEFNLSKFNFLQTFLISELLSDKKYKMLLFEIFKIDIPHSIKLTYNMENLEKKELENKSLGYSDIATKIEQVIEFLKKLEHDIIKVNSCYLEKFFKLVLSVVDLEIEFKLEFQTENGEKIKLSSGEKTVLFYLKKIDFLIDQIKKKKKDSILLFDEIELYLHPTWQKRILNIILKFIETEKIKNLLHIVIASHSPFILSDLPKENVIFLKDGKQENPNIETFGANIHTLLSHGFFMNGGLMGEFAKSKINEVIDYLNGKASPIADDDEAQRYIRIIGEPIVKRQLQRMLDSKKLDKMKEIDALKSQIESLQSRLENLENES